MKIIATFEIAVLWPAGDAQCETRELWAAFAILSWPSLYGPSVILFYIYTKLQSTPDNSNFQVKSKKVRVIGSSKNMAGSKEKKQFTLHSEHFNHI